MKVIGLTGGIGSGKSTVARFFSELGAFVIDADQVDHLLLRTDTELIQILFQEFGAVGDRQTLQIDRKKLAQIVFQDPQKLKRLEALIHPRIRESIFKQIAAVDPNRYPLVLVDAALLVETRLYQAFEGLIVVKANLDQQIERLQKREGYPFEEIEKRIRFQLPLEAKLEVANWVIDNSYNLEHTKQQVSQLFRKIVQE